MPYTLESLELLVRTTPPDRSAFNIGGGSGAKPAKRRPRAILIVKAALTDARGNTSWGVSGDRPSFGWLDKRPKYDADQKLQRLFRLVEQARDIYLQDAFTSPFVHWQRCYEEVTRVAASMDHEPLSAAYASALMERAMIDAFCRLKGVSLFDAVRMGQLGFDASSAHPNAKLVLPARPRTTFSIRHTVGLADPLLDSDIPNDRQINDGEPESLESYLKRDGLRCFKVKISGEPGKDLDRLGRVWSVIAKADTPLVTLDGNESYQDLDTFAEFVHDLEQRHLGLFQHISFIEQPLTRQLTHDASTATAIRKLAMRKPLVIDEADGDLDSFANALRIGYAGVSHKNCKGFFKSLLNKVRCQQLPKRQAFQSGEDLSNMPLAPLHQDFVSLGLLDIAHCERNGHHYGFGLSHLTSAEKRLVQQHHSDLYVRRGNEWFLNILGGAVRTRSLQCSGFGMRFPPQWDALTPLDQWVTVW